MTVNPEMDNAWLAWARFEEARDLELRLAELRAQQQARDVATAEQMERMWRATMEVGRP